MRLQELDRPTLYKGLERVDTGGREQYLQHHTEEQQQKEVGGQSTSRDMAKMGKDPP
jgi:hypothetical protein